MNLNAIQTFLTAILAALPILLVNLGCTQDATGRLDCSTAFVSPIILGYVATAIGFLKLVVIPAMQPGGWFRNLFAPKVPVSPTGDPGTVTQTQVDSGPKK